MLIAIDHGNKQIKTRHKTFVSGLMESDVRPPLGDEFLFYNGKYYFLTDRRRAYQRDKTTDETYFILTLFGIAYEILAANNYSPTEPMPVELLVGLPPAHYGKQYQRFEAYFRYRQTVKFQFGGKPFMVQICNVRAYPQAYAAAMTVFGQLRTLPKCVVIDIGGFTTDYLALKNGAPDMSICNSLEYGVIFLYNQIIEEINNSYDLLLDESDIDSVLRGSNQDLAEDLQQAIRVKAAAYVAELFGKLRERMIDLRATKAIFVGGGAVLLQPYIEASGRTGKSLFVTDISANAKGYEMLYRVECAQEKVV